MVAPRCERDVVHEGAVAAAEIANEPGIVTPAQPRVLTRREGVLEPQRAARSASDEATLAERDAPWSDGSAGNSLGAGTFVQEDPHSEGESRCAREDCKLVNKTQ